MHRRRFISATLGAVASTPFLVDGSPSALQKAPTLIRPPLLSAGDTVGVLASGTAVSDPDKILRAKQVIDYFGLKMKLAPYVLSGSGYKSRSVAERVADLHTLFQDDSVKAIFELRGGYGSAQLLDHIDYQLIRQNPKIFLGFSDITALHVAIHQQAHLVTFHGPVLISAFPEYTIEHLRKALLTSEPIGQVSNSNSKRGIRRRYPLRTIRSGQAKGQLIGGNLTLISTTMGTPYEIDTRDKILFLEDTGEKPYKIDRMLTQLRLAGKLQAAAGIIFGECYNCDSRGYAWDYALGEVLDQLLGSLTIPVLYGLTIGHTAEQLTLPIGVEAELDADEGLLNILQPGVRGSRDYRTERKQKDKV